MTIWPTWDSVHCFINAVVNRRIQAPVPTLEQRDLKDTASEGSPCLESSQYNPTEGDSAIR